jgi:hypothetical protein
MPIADQPQPDPIEQDYKDLCQAAAEYDRDPISPSVVKAALTAKRKHFESLLGPELTVSYRFGYDEDNDFEVTHDPRLALQNFFTRNTLNKLIVNYDLLARPYIVDDPGTHLMSYVSSGTYEPRWENADRLRSSPGFTPRSDYALFYNLIDVFQRTAILQPDAFLDKAIWDKLVLRPGAKTSKAVLGGITTWIKWLTENVAEFHAVANLVDEHLAFGGENNLSTDYVNTVTSWLHAMKNRIRSVEHHANSLEADRGTLTNMFAESGNYQPKNEYSGTLQISAKAETFMPFGMTNCDLDTCFRSGGEFRQSPGLLAGTPEVFSIWIKDEHNQPIARAWGALLPGGGHAPQPSVIVYNTYAGNMAMAEATMRSAMAKLLAEADEPWHFDTDTWQTLVGNRTIGTGWGENAPNMYLNDEPWGYWDDHHREVGWDGKIIVESEQAIYCPRCDESVPRSDAVPCPGCGDHLCEPCWESRDEGVVRLGCQHAEDAVWDDQDRCYNCVYYYLNESRDPQRSIQTLGNDPDIQVTRCNCATCRDSARYDHIQDIRCNECHAEHVASLSAEDLASIDSPLAQDTANVRWAPVGSAITGAVNFSNYHTYMSPDQAEQTGEGP